jgi:hypothetical protein
MSERRSHVRQPANVVVNVSTETRKDRVGVTSDLSETGMLFHSLSRFSVGERVDIVFGEADAERVASGRVVRTSRDTRWHLFPNVTAIRFDSDKN